MIGVSTLVMTVFGAGRVMMVSVVMMELIMNRVVVMQSVLIVTDQLQGEESDPCNDQRLI